jgi:hypothetical protein
VEAEHLAVEDPEQHREPAGPHRDAAEGPDRVGVKAAPNDVADGGVEEAVAEVADHEPVEQRERQEQDHRRVEVPVLGLADRLD